MAPCPAAGVFSEPTRFCVPLIRYAGQLGLQRARQKDRRVFTPTALDFCFPSLRSKAMQFPELERITLNPLIMGGKPCIRGMRVTVGTIVGLVASGASFEEILQLYSYLESEDIRAAVAYAAWRSEEREAPLRTA
jgi:uncharacterized protein (DUF433 family)